jgi:NAD(P)-dependent dehydrogenase (short-subunit alcohol dehydrogenase family)
VTLTSTIHVTGKRAIVVGGASGIGKASAIALANEGADVAVLDVDATGAAEVSDLVRAAGRKAFNAAVDVRHHDEMVKSIAAAADALGGIDILVNSAGIPEYKYFWQIDESMWDRMIDVNLKGVYNGMAAVMDRMRSQRSGRIINISSVGGIIGTPLHSHYSAAKAGVIGLSKAAAKELAADNITVNVVAPGLVDTPLTKQNSPGPWKEMVIGRTPMGRTGKPDEIAGAVLFLASDAASFFTGQVISPNGGYVI